MILCAGDRKDFGITLLTAMHMLVRAWEQVTATTIANCFRHSGFAAGSAQDSCDVGVDGAEELMPVALHGTLQGASFVDYVEVDTCASVCGALNDEDIIARVAGEQPVAEEPEGEEDEDDEVPVRPSASEVTEALNVTHLFFSFEEGEEDSLRSVRALEQRAAAVAFREKKQMSTRQPAWKRVDIAKDLGLPLSTLNSIVSKRAEIEGNAALFGPKAKQARGAKYGNLDDALLTWFKQACAAGINFDGSILREKAMEIADRLGITDFAASNGWIDRFRKRHGIAYKTHCFARCGFGMDGEEETAIEDEEPEAASSEEELNEAMNALGATCTTYDDYVAVDAAVMTSECQSIAQIVANSIASEAGDCDNDDKHEPQDSVQLPDPSFGEVVAALDLLRRWCKRPRSKCTQVKPLSTSSEDEVAVAPTDDSGAADAPETASYFQTCNLDLLCAAVKMVRGECADEWARPEDHLLCGL
ncbi:hypothetical protein MTO96_043753 [Rhipicephalus appendiculatus]